MTATSETTLEVAWFGGTALWVVGAATEIATGGEGPGFVLFEVLWIAAHLAVLAGLIGLGQLRPYGDSRVGSVGLRAAMVARVVFVLGELDCLRTGTNDSVLLPVAALGTALGMIMLGAAVARRGRWTGWRRFAPLSMGIYPVLVMFPVVAVTGEPSPAAIGGWAIALVAVGAAAIQETRRRDLVGAGTRDLAAP